ncbi:MAG TPA: hypothetical protein VJ861_09810 [Treponemataceae bacterium]|nr:hypothetical protein [Treponemataceae bacterium]
MSDFLKNNRKEITEVLVIIDQILPLIDEAEDKFKSARNWGFIDILGGGFLVDLIKHSKLGSASTIMNRINSLLQDLQRELKDVVIPTDFSMNTATFATFADFLFDGILADVYMQSKIMSSLEQVRELQNRLVLLRSKLKEIRTRA